MKILIFFIIRNMTLFGAKHSEIKNKEARANRKEKKG